MSIEKPLAEVVRARPMIDATEEALHLLEELAMVQGPQVLVLNSISSALSSVTIVSEKDFAPDNGLVLVTQMGPCLVYADVAQVMQCPHDAIVITRGSGRWNAPELVTRPESTAENQRRILGRNHRRGWRHETHHALGSSDSAGTQSAR